MRPAWQNFLSKTIQTLFLGLKAACLIRKRNLTFTGIYQANVGGVCLPDRGKSKTTGGIRNITQRSSRSN